MGGQLTKYAWPARSPLPKDSILYTYDSMGRALTMTQPARDRKIMRTYFARGFLKTEVQSLVNGTFPNTMTYAYDRNGRRTYHLIGTVGVLNSSDSIWYRYAAVSGDLAVVGVRWRNPISPPTPDSVQFVWDTLGRRSKVTYRRGVVIQYAYDKDGMLRLVCGTQTPDNQPVGYNAFKFTVYHQTVDVDGQIRRTTNYSTGLTGCGQNLGMLDVITASYDSRHQLLMQVAGIDSLIYRYDGSGNRTKKRNFVRGTASLSRDEANYMDATHNRLRSSADLLNPGDSTRFIYDADGARYQEMPYRSGQPQPSLEGYRNYFFDAMGRSTGTAEYFPVPQPGGGTVLQYVDYSTRCWYDPVGRPYGSCENGSPLLGFDGHNAVRTGQDSYTYAYTFVQGPVTDDPLFGYNPGLPKYLYYVTDGQGRQYVVADTVGVNMSGDFAYYGAANGGKYAGGTTNASSFGASRNPNELGAAQLSAFRNRFYDQRTGRWTQEDPIGVAGGLNLYGYVGNNPVAYTDPFGLCPIKKDGVPCAVTFAAGGAAAGFATGVAASVAAAAPTLGGSLVISPATVTATTLTGLAGGALIGLAKDVSDNAQVLASAAAPLWDRIKRKVAGVATGIAIALGGGKSKEQEETNQTPPAVEQEAEQKPRDEP
ncbi:MAG: RHS repeat-associated core domain-containing protein [Gemmatimonadales bacterium]